MATDGFAGPIGYLVYSFPEGASVATGVQAVLDRVAAGLIEVLDVEVVGRAADGSARLLPFAEVSGMDQLTGAESDILDEVDLRPAVLRADLEGPRTSPRYIWSAVELLDRAADLLSDSAGLVHDNERRWRVFHQRVAPLVDPS